MRSHNLCANSLRALAVDQVESAQSGHPGVALGFADVVTVLWRYHMRYDVKQPLWQNRDRFVFSNGHASALYYATLHMAGFPLDVDDLKAFRSLGSRTPGHPERDLSLGIDMTTGPLGQGLANGVGMAMSRHYLASRFNKPDYTLIDYYTYVMVGDGCLMEGISHESASLAGCLGLAGLIVCWDDNQVSIDGKTDCWMQEDVPKRFRAYNWHVIEDIDGHDPSSIDSAIRTAKSVLDKPVLLCFKTKIGLGSAWEDDCKSHGQPLGQEQVSALKKLWGFSQESFAIPEDAYRQWNLDSQISDYELWDAMIHQYRHKHTDLWQVWSTFSSPQDLSFLDTHLQQVYTDLGENKDLATRKASAKCLSVLTKLPVGLIGGSADLSGSTGLVKNVEDVWIPKKKPGSFIHFGVREFGMFAIANGIAGCQGLRPYVSTFLVFSDYGINAVRMAAMMRLPVIFIFSHDSIFVGEDGPTHQPIEHLDHLRAIPDLNVWRPANTHETFCTWRNILVDVSQPHCLILSRQSLPDSDGADLLFSDVAQGAYVVHSVPDARGVIIASGSEVTLALQLARRLEQQGISLQVVSVVCLERFAKLDDHVKQSLFMHDGSFRVVIEASSGFCWYRYVHNPEAVICLTGFGASGSGHSVYESLGFSLDLLHEKVKKLYHSFCEENALTA